jgi:hypothetical protein
MPALARVQDLIARVDMRDDAQGIAEHDHRDAFLM